MELDCLLLVWIYAVHDLVVEMSSQHMALIVVACHKCEMTFCEAWILRGSKDGIILHDVVLLAFTLNENVA